ncbi:MAG: dienelactone hydrolase family protein, partial [Gammaproteobacteria bacterium]|nr:dienelactone hydrolase family protein [Gammaproteobacteria bacterium]
AYNLLRKHKTVLHTRMAAIGYCFGGSVVLDMARQGVRLKAVASFHGGLTTSKAAEPGKVKAKILVLNGKADPFVRAEQVEAFKKEMEYAKVKYKFVSYPQARHAFTNPTADFYGNKFNLPLAYNRRADERSWKELKRFFGKYVN